jgi:hypothetical protein
VKHDVAAEYRQISKYCERCSHTTPHQVRENDGVVAKICVVCLLRGYLSAHGGVEGQIGHDKGRT